MLTPVSSHVLCFDLRGSGEQVRDLINRPVVCLFGTRVRGTCTLFLQIFVVYYESIKRELKTKPIYECRCDERLETRVEGSRVYLGIYTPRMHWGARQNKLETPKDKDEVNKQDIRECDG